MPRFVTLVDDSYELRFLIEMLFKRELGIQCLSLSSLEEVAANAEAVLKSEAAILDINLGTAQPDGVAVYHWLKGQRYQGKIFFLTGHAKESPQVQQATRTGARVFEKPMTPDDFIGVFKAAMSSDRTEDIGGR